LGKAAFGEGETGFTRGPTLLAPGREGRKWGQSTQIKDKKKKWGEKKTLVVLFKKSFCDSFGETKGDTGQVKNKKKKGRITHPVFWRLERGAKQSRKLGKQRFADAFEKGGVKVGFTAKVAVEKKPLLR